MELTTYRKYISSLESEKLEKEYKILSRIKSENRKIETQDEIKKKIRIIIEASKNRNNDNYVEKRVYKNEEREVADAELKADPNFLYKLYIELLKLYIDNNFYGDKISGRPEDYWKANYMSLVHDMIVQGKSIEEIKRIIY